MPLICSAILALTASAGLKSGDTIDFFRTNGREKELSDGWEFRRPGGDWHAVTVPHDWAIGGSFDRAIDRQVVRIVENGETKATEKTGRTGSLPWIGSGEYRRRLALPADAEWASLVFDGAMSEPEVFLDGRRIGGWKYGYTPFEVELGAGCAGGGHELVVRLNNREQSSRWYPGAGLYRPVRLRWGRKVGVKTWGQQILTPDLRTVVVRTDLRNPDGARTEVSYRVLGPDGAEVTCGPSPLEIPRPRPWTPEDPALYTLETTVKANGETVEVRRDRFGLRTIRYGADGFRLNGELRKFRGVCLHHDLGPLGTAFSKDAFRRQVQLLKEMGCDSIRTAHNIPAPGQLDVCDEEGVMVMAESFDAWEMAKVPNGYNLWFADWWRRDLTQLVLSARNHPSVVMWSIGNEIPDQSTARGAALTREMQTLVHSLDGDPNRLCTQGASSFPAAIESGVIAAMEIPAATYRLPFYGAIRASSELGIMLGAETASTVSSRGTYAFPDEPGMMVKRDSGQSSGYDTEYCSWSNLPDDDWAVQEDSTWTIGEFVWTGFDYLGEPTPYDEYWPSRSSYFGILDLAGLPKDRYWLYRAHWNAKSPTLHILPHWTWPGHEGKRIPVYVYTSYPSAELFVNGRSEGRRSFVRSSRLDRFRLRWREVPYEPGELKVVAYDADGKAVAAKTVRTAGPFARFKEESEDFGVLRFVTVTAVDEKGETCPDFDGVYEVTVPEGWRFKAICNGDATSLEPFSSPRMRLFKGQLVYILERKARAASAASYWCTWETQNCTIAPDRQVKTLGFVGDQGAQGARDNIDEEVLFGKDGKGGWVEACPPETRKDLYLLIDDGWDVPYLQAPGKDVSVFGSLVVDAKRFPSFTGTPAERLAKFNAAVKARGWKGLALWCATQCTGESWGGKGRPAVNFDDAAVEKAWRERFRRCHEAGIGYLKFDWGARGGQVEFRRLLSRIAREVAPEILIEHCTGAVPLNEPERMFGNPAYDENRAKAKDLMGFADLFRIYDLLNPFVYATAAERCAFYLEVQAEAGGRCLLSTEDEIYLGASLGCAFGVMRSPFLPDERCPVRLQGRRMTEVDRAVAWQRLAPPFASAEKPRISKETLADSWTYPSGSTWYRKAEGHVVVQKAPAVLSRGLELPVVTSAEADGSLPFVTACRYPNGLVSVGCIPRMAENSGIRTPKADVVLAVAAPKIAVFGTIGSLTVPDGAGRVLARDLAGGTAEDLTAKGVRTGGQLRIPGGELNRIGTARNGARDLSDPGVLVEFRRF